MGCIKYQYNSLEEKVEKIAVATSYEAGWIDDTLQDIYGQKIWHIIYKMQKTCNENPILKCTDQLQTFIESWSVSTALVPNNWRFSQVH